MKLIEINNENDIKPFDCGDADLNGFLIDDAIAFHNKHTRLMYYDMNEMY